MLRRKPAKPPVWLYLLLLLCLGCAGSHSKFSADRKFTLPQLQKDYTLFRNILEESHPSLTWYTTEDSMRYFFDEGYHQLKDSMTEPEFRTILAYVIAKLHCGHTSTRYSKKYIHYLDTAHLPIFPVSIKVLPNDTVVLNAPLSRKKASLPKGTILKRFEGMPIGQLIDSMGQYIPSDGYNTGYLRQALSNRGAFGAWLRLIRGSKSTYSIGYLDSNGKEQTTIFSLEEPRAPGSPGKTMPSRTREKLSRHDRMEARLLEARSMQVDTGLSTAYMTLNTFNNGYRLHSFIQSSFRDLKKENIRHLIIDIRSNGGGNVNHSTYLTRMLADKPFKLADSLYATNRKSRYEKHIQYKWFSGIFLSVLTRKEKDGKYHFGYFERHVYKPFTKSHYNGNVYVLTGPNSFSAAAIFARAVKGQNNVILVGEETGGGYYGNTAWFIPNVSLPETGIRFRLPKFRLVIDKNSEKNGRGVMPDILVQASRLSVIQNRDLKVEKVRELILSPGKSPVSLSAQSTPARVPERQP